MAQELELPELPKCGVCYSDDKFLIQKEIDKGELPADIAETYTVPRKEILRHIADHHREKLIAYGLIDYTIRKKAVNMAEMLLKMIEKWEKGLDQREDRDVKDADVIRAMELYQKMQGTLVEKSEVTVKRSVDDAIKDYLEKD